MIERADQKEERAAIEAWLREAREALDRQRGGPWYRGDGRTIIDALDDLLDRADVDAIMRGNLKL